MHRFVVRLLVLGTFFQGLFCSTFEEDHEFRVFVRNWIENYSTQDTNLFLIRAARLGYEHTVESLLYIPKTQKGPNLAGVQMAAEHTSCPKILMLLMLAPEADKTISANALLRIIVDEAREIKYAYVLFRLPEGLKPNRGFMLYAFDKAIDLRWLEMVAFLSKQPGYFMKEDIIDRLKFMAKDESLAEISVLLINYFQFDLNRYETNLLCTIASEHSNQRLVSYFLTGIPQHLKLTKKAIAYAYERASTMEIKRMLECYYNYRMNFDRS
jgi:hypothetical protein